MYYCTNIIQAVKKNKASVKLHKKKSLKTDRENQTKQSFPSYKTPRKTSIIMHSSPLSV